MIIPSIWENKSHVPVTTNQTYHRLSILNQPCHGDRADSSGFIKRGVSSRCCTVPCPWQGRHLIGLKRSQIFACYPLVNIYITMENHHVQWKNPLFLRPWSIVMVIYHRVYPSNILNHCKIL